MNRLLAILAMLLVIGVVFGCSKGNNPVTPTDPGNQPLATTSPSPQDASTYLWGYYDVALDIENKSASVVPNRSAMFTLNVVTFLNSTPSGISFMFNGFHPGTGYLDVDLDVSVKHPISGQPKFNGYDVRGVFIGNGSGTLVYNSDLKYAKSGTDQLLLPNPDTGFGGPDGYTRWFNQPEFTTSGIFGYTKGNYATKNYTSTATLNPYKYFADGLGATGDAWTFLSSTTGHGVFSSGTTNTRNYYIRFPVPSPGAKFGYAIIANWKSGKPQDHPSNAPEAPAASVTVTSHPYFVSNSDKGGSLGLDVMLFGWNGQPSTIFVESTVLSSAYQFSPGDMTPVDSGQYWAKYHVSIPADNVLGLNGNEFWVIAQYNAFDYTNPAGVSNTAGTDKLAAAFRYSLTISSTKPNLPPVINSGVTGDAAPAPGSIKIYNVNAVDPDLDTLTYSWRVTDVTTSNTVMSGPGDGSGNLTIHWGTDFPAGEGQAFTIDCSVSDPTNPPVNATTLNAVVTAPNLPPDIISGVTGNATPAPGSTEVYNVSAVDPESDILNYVWRVTDVATSNTVMSGPGDGNGNLTIHWGTDFPAIDGQEFTIDCSVMDPVNPPVSATQLDVVVTSAQNQPPVIISGVDGNAWPTGLVSEDYSVMANDPDGDPLTYTWILHNQDSGTTTTTVGTDIYPVDWSTMGVNDGDKFDIGCDVSDSINPPVSAVTLQVTINTSGQIILYEYNGLVDDGGIVDGTWGPPNDLWTYCPSESAWQQSECVNYQDNTFELCRTPYIQFPNNGTFTDIHIEIDHWGDMTTDGNSYGDLGYAYDNGGVDYQAPNWDSDLLVYVDGFNFNDPTGYSDFTSVYGSQASPVHSHFTANAYAGNNYALCLAMEEFGATSGGTHSGWHVRHIKVWVEP